MIFLAKRGVPWPVALQSGFIEKMEKMQNPGRLCNVQRLPDDQQRRKIPINRINGSYRYFPLLFLAKLSPPTHFAKKRAEKSMFPSLF